MAAPQGVRMDIEHVREFVSVVDEGGFTRAASACHTTQPAVSRHMAELERELGAPLLVRGKQTVPTAEGSLFYDDALRLLQDWDLALARLKAFRRARPMGLDVTSFVGYKLTDDLVRLLPEAFRKQGARLSPDKGHRGRLAIRGPTPRGHRPRAGSHAGGAGLRRPRAGAPL